MSRLESGPVRCGDDWAGIFIRGDQALAFSLAVTGIMEAYRNAESPTILESIEGQIALAQLDGLAKTLASCQDPCQAEPIEREGSTADRLVTEADRLHQVRTVEGVENPRELETIQRRETALRYAAKWLRRSA